MFNLYNQAWPILTWLEPLPPAKFVFEDAGRTGHALDSIICAGVIVAGGTVRRSVVSPGVRLEAGSLVEGSILLHSVEVGPRAIVRNAIVDKNVRIAAGAQDRRRPRARPRALRRFARWDRRDRQGRDGGGLSCASQC